MLSISIILIHITFHSFFVSEMEMEKDSDCDDYSALSFRSYLENGDEHDREAVLDDDPWPPSPSSQELFLFFSDFASAGDRCGKIVRGGDAVAERNDEPREVDCFRSSSFCGKRPEAVSLSSSASQKVNISSLASMSAKSMRRTFIFGPAKFKPEMDLVAIKERQRRLSSTRVLPVVANAAAGEGAENGGGKSERVQLTRCPTRNHLSTVLAKPFSCFTVTK